MTIEINGTEYNFRFGIGFLKTIDKKQTAKTPQGVDKPIGFITTAAGLVDGNILDLCDVLMTANSTEDPKIKREVLEDYLDDENTDIDKLFKDTIRFLSKSNACKMYMTNLKQFLEKNKTQDDVVAFPIPES